MKKRIAIVGTFMATMLLANAPAAYAGHDISAKTGGYCTLTNMRVEKTLYDGHCTIKETINKHDTIWSIKMGDAEPMLFAGNGTHYMHGPEEVTFHDRGSSGTFTWGEFRLEVYQD
jgi:hypothetical protein